MSATMNVPINDLQRAAVLAADEIQSAIGAVLSSGRYILGDEVAAFEREFATYCGVADCVSVASGSDALELALRAVGVNAGDEVVTVANAAMYATLAITAIGARPVYVDVDDGPLTASARSIEAALTPRTRAIVVTHLYGRLAEIEPIALLARGLDIPIIEDCAQAHGAHANGKRAGTFGDIGCFSFYPTKNLGAMGDGGALTTNDPQLARRLRSLRQYGWQTKYVVSAPGGRNSRLDELQAAVLRKRLARLDAANSRRRAIARAYTQQIQHAQIRTPEVHPTRYVAHLYVLRAAERESLRAHLGQCGVGTEVHYPIPDHRQPIMAAQCSSIRLETTERASLEILTLPCFPELRDSEVEFVIDSCNSWTPPTTP